MNRLDYRRVTFLKFCADASISWPKDPSVPQAPKELLNKYECTFE
jgi:hypothetical protein